MAGTYTQLYIHYVFTVKGRKNLLHHTWRTEVFKYMAGIAKEKNQKPIIVNGVSDHVHVLIGIRPSTNISELIRDIKNNSSNFINKQKYLKGKFQWQEGFGAFSCSHSQLEKVYQYIFNQESHHSKKSFKEEYYELLKKSEIEFDDKYLFEWIN